MSVLLLALDMFLLYETKVDKWEEGDELLSMGLGGWGGEDSSEVVSDDTDKIKDIALCCIADHSMGTSFGTEAGDSWDSRGSVYALVTVDREMEDSLINRRMTIKVIFTVVGMLETYLRSPMKIHQCFKKK